MRRVQSSIGNLLVPMRVDEYSPDKLGWRALRSLEDLGVFGGDGAADVHQLDCTWVAHPFPYFFDVEGRAANGCCEQ